MTQSLNFRLNKTQWSFLLAALVSVGLRFILLGRTNLSDTEALNALQALAFGRGEDTVSGGDPGYVLLTSLLFDLFSTGNFTARLLPVICGIGLSLTPFLFRKQLGDRAALLLTFGLAFDACWVAVSRQASGMSWAGLFIVLCLAAILGRKPVLLGVSAALGILGGSGFWIGAIGLGAAYLVYSLVFKPSTPESEDDESSELVKHSSLEWKTILPWFLGTLVLSATLLLTKPSGIGILASGFTGFLAGLGGDAHTPLALMILGLPVAQPLGILFALVALVRSIRSSNQMDVFLTVWWLVSLVLVVLYPSRDITMLGWPILPMLALAARQIAGLLKPDVEHGWVAIGQAVLVVALMVFAWFSFIAFFQPRNTEIDPIVRVITTLAPILLILGGILAVRTWWTDETAGQGTLWGLLAILVLWGFSSAWNGTGNGANPEGQLWRSSPMIDEVDLLNETVSDLSTWKMREPGELELIVSGVESPGLRWTLRDYPQAKFVTATAPSSSPALVVTGEMPAPDLAATYRGQDFVLRVTPAWSAMTLDEWLKWAAFKSVPVDKETIVLWARADLFADAEGFNP